MQDPIQLPVPTQFACGKDHTVVAAQGKFYGFGKGEQGQFGHVKGLQEVSGAQRRRQRQRPKEMAGRLTGSQGGGRRS